MVADRLQRGLFVLDRVDGYSQLVTNHMRHCIADDIMIVGNQDGGKFVHHFPRAVRIWLAFPIDEVR